MNKDAGRGGPLIVTVRLENGEKLPMMVDTGCPFTTLDKSLEPKLGKCVSPYTIWMWGVKTESGLYGAPKLYLGNTLLKMTGPYVAVYDFKQISNETGYRIMGFLGMDVLEHYCIQLDFNASKIRFLDPDRLNPTGLGKAFFLTLSSEGQSDKENVSPFIHCDTLIGGKNTAMLIDTGCRFDGTLESKLFQQEVLKHKLQVAQAFTGGWVQKCVWNDETYSNLWIGDGGINRSNGNGGNAIGLEFLARHLVTFNFPKRMMYLKQTSVGPLLTNENSK
ncbi:MAG: retropepsin-like aspartic protease [Limisphaerales bacterium]